MSKRPKKFTNYPVLDAKQVIGILIKAGFKLKHSKGSHKTYVKGPFVVQVPDHGTVTLDPKTLRSIISQSGMTRSEFYGLLGLAAFFICNIREVVCRITGA